MLAYSGIGWGKIGVQLSSTVCLSVWGLPTLSNPISSNKISKDPIWSKALINLHQLATIQDSLWLKFWLIDSFDRSKIAEKGWVSCYAHLITINHGVHYNKLYNKQRKTSSDFRWNSPSPCVGQAHTLMLTKVRLQSNNLKKQSY